MSGHGLVRGIHSHARRNSAAYAISLSALLAVAYLLWYPQTTDLAAQTFRADLWGESGFVIWNPNWYDGHTIPGYSLLYPPLGASLGPALLGALSAVTATALFARLALRGWGDRAWLGVIWFGLASGVALYSGRTTFALGLALGLGALLAVQRDRSWAAAALAVLTAAASPVAGLFLALAGASIALASRWSPLGSGPTAGLPVAAALAAAAGSLLTIAAFALAFPSSGYHPFSFTAFIWLPLLALVVLALGDRRAAGPLLWGVCLYALLGVAAVLIETPLGGNVTRLGATFAGPVLAVLLLRRHPVLLALLAVPLLWWQWGTTIEDVARAERDPSTEAAYYEPLIEELATRRAPGRPLKLHVPPTQSRWESVYLGERFPMTRGWMRQEETGDFALFREGPIDPSAYVQWLSERAVSYVAVPDAEPDYLAETELDLVSSGSYPLREVWSDEHWRLFAVPGSAGSGGVADLRLQPDGFTVDAAGARDSIPVRYSPYFEVVDGEACVAEDPARPRRTLLTPAAGAAELQGTVTVRARLSVTAVLGREEHCFAGAG